MSSAQRVYEQNIKPLSPLEQLKLASLILEHLANSADAKVELSDAWTDLDIREVTEFSLRHAEQVRHAEDSDV